MTEFVMVLVDGIDETQRTLMHAQIKKQSKGWWHEMPDVWIVESNEAVEVWRQRLGVFVPHAPALLLVFKLPSPGERKWSGSGVKSKWVWILENYATPGGKPPMPVLAEVKPDDDEPPF